MVYTIVLLVFRDDRDVWTEVYSAGMEYDVDSEYAFQCGR